MRGHIDLCYLLTTIVSLGYTRSIMIWALLKQKYRKNKLLKNFPHLNTLGIKFDFTKGQSRIIICANIEGPKSPMLHTRSLAFYFQRFFFTLYGRGGHLGHVTRNICANFHSPILGSLHMKFWELNWPSGFVDV